eukprot:4283522-Amphidinium_carterae.1
MSFNPIDAGGIPDGLWQIQHLQQMKAAALVALLMRPSMSHHAVSRGRHRTDSSTKGPLEYLVLHKSECMAVVAEQIRSQGVLGRTQIVFMLVEFNIQQCGILQVQ